jgi:hypothetical protein
MHVSFPSGISCPEVGGGATLEDEEEEVEGAVDFVDDDNGPDSVVDSNIFK